jgi:hypothetical protein
MTGISGEYPIPTMDISDDASYSVPRGQPVCPVCTVTSGPGKASFGRAVMTLRQVLRNVGQRDAVGSYRRRLDDLEE